MPDTKKLQEKIDEVCRLGGGTVEIPAGEYRIGSLRLYSNMTLHLQAGAKLYGSKDYRDYTDYHVPTTMKYMTDPEYKEKWNLPDYYIYGIFCAFGEENISIIGDEGSLIDGQDCFDANGEEKFRGPMGLIFSNCRNITLKGYTVANSANWSHQIDSCENIVIENVTVKAGHDGFNLHHCTGITIKNCDLKTGDDCVAGYDVKDLRVSGCFLNTACNSMRIGGTDLLFEDCVFEGPGRYPHRSEHTFYTHAMFKYYAIGLDTIRKDAENIRFRNCRFQNVTRLFAYQQGNKDWMQDNRPLRGLTMEHVRIDGLEKTALLLGGQEPCMLTLKDAAFGAHISCPDGVVLEVDDAVTLNLQHVTCEVPVKIRVSEGSTVRMDGCVNIELEEKQRER